MVRASQWFSAGFGGALLTSALLPASAIPALLPCPFKLLTGWPCPGCGLTHAICDISHGALAAAWTANPFGYFFYFLLVMGLLWPLLEGPFPALNAWLRTSRALLWAPPALVVFMWAFDISRIVRR
jgi:Protein of unknown function (DUF2752)